MKKYLFFGAKNDLTDFFVEAQDEGFIEFITSKKEKTKELPEPIRKLIEAIKILRKQPVKEPYRGGGDLEFADEISNQILDLTHEIEKLSEEKRHLEAEISRVAPFGQFSFDDIAFIEEKGHKKIQFYCVKSTKRHEIQDEDSLIYIGTEYDLDYFIGIHDRPQSYPGMIEMHFDRTAEELTNHLAYVDETLHQVEAELKGYAGHLNFLRDALLGQFDIHTLAKTKQSVNHPLGPSTFSIEGWVPENLIEKLPILIANKSIIYEEISIEGLDRVPTYMENNEMNRLGEDLVLLYDVPSANDKDPSGWVLWAFALFFAMIIADMGYGLLYLGIAFFLKYKFPDLKASGKRFLKLLFILSISCVIWGVFISSFLGVTIDPQSPFAKLSVINYLSTKKAEYHKRKNDAVYKYWVVTIPSIKKARTGKEMLSMAVVKKEGKTSYPMLNRFSDNILLEFSLLIGLIHICTGLIRYLPRRWPHIGWIAFAVGGYLYFPMILHATSIVEFLGWIQRETAATLGFQMLIGGGALALILAVIQRKLKGLDEVMQGIQIFADILSYLRLYALALASAMMARTFNDMGLKLGLAIGFVVILLGHGVNFLLSTMSGVIHSLRLNFIEWYRYCFEGEGRLFSPLRKLKKQEK